VATKIILNRTNMKNLLRSLLLLSCISMSCPNLTLACGYAWIGDCSSQVQLRINGTLDSFDIATCPAGYNFDGIQLGNLQTLSLADAKTITWESCQNNVSAVFLKYRVYEQGSSPGIWQSLTLQQYHQTIDGPYTTRYNHAPSNISITNGLTIGKTYLLEVYFLAEIDTIGNDFIPETTLFKNNNGANYKMQFSYGGPSAHPILLLPHLTQPSCHGAGNGNIRISAYGSINGLFYNWSNISLNFFQQFNIQAGTYGITVTNASGQTASAAMQLGQPEPLSVNFNNIHSIGCNSSPGHATVYGSGGTAPYHYLWQNGQQNDTVYFPSSGNYYVTVTDARNCSATGWVSIGNNGLLERSITANICEGAVYIISGQVFSAADTYTFTVPGTNGCDTLTHLTLNVLTPSDALTPLPDSILVTCQSPAISLCATALPGAAFQWLKDGITAGAAPCLLVTAGGEYKLQVQLGGCSASKTIVSAEHLMPVAAQVSGQYYPDCNGSLLPAWLTAHTDAEDPVFEWTYQGNILSTSDSCYFQITEFQGGQPLFPTLRITDKYGCENTAPFFAVLIVQLAPLSVSATVTPASSSNAADGAVSLFITGGFAPYSYSWANGESSTTISGLLPGVYCVTVTDDRNCSINKCFVVSSTTASISPEKTALRLFPNPVAAGNQVQVSFPENLQGSTLMMEVMDVQGRVLWKEPVQVSPENLVFAKIQPSFQQPTLLIRLTGATNTYIAKIIVQIN
jgi:SprB repeat